MLFWDTSGGGELPPSPWPFLQCNLSIELESTIEFDAGFTAKSILHPATYLNKVLVASSQGAMQLWNIHSQ